MKLGFITNSLAEEAKRQGSDAFSDIKKTAKWAIEHGFEDLECGPSLPLDEELYAEVIAEGKISITALIYCRNYLSTDEAEAAAHIKELKRRIEAAGRLGIEKVITSTGIDKSIEEGIYDRDPSVKDRANMIRRIPMRSMDRFLEVFDPIIDLAEKNNVRLCFENCPLMGNIAISPVMWRRIFERIGSRNVGLAYDPSHLVWELIDPYEPIEEFASKIFHFHAKDTLVDRHGLKDGGILTDFSWWQYKIPGRGELNWKRIFELLEDIGYDGTISIEHEDKDFEGSIKAVEDGITLSADLLRRFMHK